MCLMYLQYIFRKFLQCIYHKKVQATNTNCEVTTDVRHDGSEPVVDVMFGKELVFKQIENPWFCVVVMLL